MTNSTLRRARIAALFCAVGCQAETTEPAVPTEQELVASAETVCELIENCAAEEDEFYLEECIDGIRGEIVGEVSECEWLWIDLNECVVGLTCEEYDFFYQTRQVGCGEENRKWKDCRLQRKGQ